jgi:structure-specific recognition protein 1
MYSGVTKMFLVPRPDDMHWNFVVGVNPPLRQGQTRYPFLVFQFEREEEIELELNIEE